MKIRTNKLKPTENANKMNKCKRLCFNLRLDLIYSKMSLFSTMLIKDGRHPNYEIAQTSGKHLKYLILKTILTNY